MTIRGGIGSGGLEAVHTGGGGGSAEIAAYQAVLPTTDNVFVDPATGSDANAGTSPFGPKLTLAAAVSTLGNGNKLWIKSGASFAEGLTLSSLSDITVDIWGGTTRARITAATNVLGVTGDWTSRTGNSGETHCWRRVYASGHRPQRLTTDLYATAAPRAVSGGTSTGINQCGMEIQGNTWTQDSRGAALWTTTVAVGDGQVLDYMSVNGGARVRRKDVITSVVSPGNWFGASNASTTFTITMYSVLNPNTNTTVVVSALWYASASAGNVTFTIFSPDGNPATVFATNGLLVDDTAVFAAGAAGTGMFINSCARVSINNLEIVSFNDGFLVAASDDVTMNNNRISCNGDAGGNFRGLVAGTSKHTVPDLTNPHLIGNEISYNGTTGAQSPQGVKFGRQNPYPDFIKGIELIGNSIIANSGDGVAFDLENGSSAYLTLNTISNNGENCMDSKRFNSITSRYNSFLGGPYSTAESGINVAIQSDTVFDSLGDTFDAPTPCGYNIVSHPNAKMYIRRGTFFSNRRGIVAHGDDVDVFGPGPHGEQIFESCVGITDTPTADFCVIKWAAGVAIHRNCTYWILATGNDNSVVRMMVGPEVLNGSISLYNSILGTEGASTSSGILRRASAVVTPTALISNCPAYKRLPSQTWVVAATVDNKTQTDYDAGFVSNGVTVSKDARAATDNTGPMGLTNIWARDASLEGPVWTQAIGNTGTNILFLQGETITYTSGATARVRNVFGTATAATLVLSALSGSANGGDTITGNRLGKGQASGAPVACMLRRLGYDTQTGAFTDGLVVTGAVSLATGLNVFTGDNGTTTAGFLQLVVPLTPGTDFTDNEAIVDTLTGAALANGVLQHSPAYRQVPALHPEVVASYTGAYVFNRIKHGTQGNTGDPISIDKATDTITRGGVGIGGVTWNYNANGVLPGDQGYYMNTGVSTYSDLLMTVLSVAVNGLSMTMSTNLTVNIGGPSFTGSRTSGSAVLTSVAGDYTGYVGTPISGTGIPSGTTIASAVAGVSVTMSANATSGSGTATTVTLPATVDAKWVKDWPFNAGAYGDEFGTYYNP